MKLSELEKILPDFDDMEQLVRIATQSNLLATKLLEEIKNLEAEYIRECILLKQYWPGGKRPTDSGTYLRKVVSRLGNTSEQKTKLKEKREELAEHRRQAQEASDLLDIAKAKISVFQTLSANKRQSLVSA